MSVLWPDQERWRRSSTCWAPVCVDQFHASHQMILLHLCPESHLIRSKSTYNSVQLVFQCKLWFLFLAYSLLLLWLRLWDLVIHFVPPLLIWWQRSKCWKIFPRLLLPLVSKDIAHGEACASGIDIVVVPPGFEGAFSIVKAVYC